MSECSISLNTWEGTAPTSGTYLRTERGRTAYEVLELKRRRPGSKTFGVVRCRRLPPAEIPEGATVFQMEWSRRG